LQPGDILITLTPSGLPRLEGRHEYTQEEVETAVMQFKIFRVYARPDFQGIGASYITSGGDFSYTDWSTTPDVKIPAVYGGDSFNGVMIRFPSPNIGGMKNACVQITRGRLQTNPTLAVGFFLSSTLCHVMRLAL
jgi:hypothetical protein